MIEEKKCHGNGKGKGYGCKKMVPVQMYGKPNRVYGLGKSCGCYGKWLLESEMGQITMQKSILKATKPRKELEAMGKERKNRKGITTLLKAVKDVCHRYIRERDKGKPCISCGTPWHDEFEAGHFFKSELYSSLRFNEDNIFGQCIRCNRMNEGNLSDYNVGIAHRIGQDRAYELHRLADLEKRNGHKKWDREELKEIRNFYKEKLKSL